MKKLITTCLIISVAGLTGCASVINNKTQKVDVVASNGQQIAGNVSGTTFTQPGTVMVERANMDKTVHVDNAECQKDTPLKKKISPAFWGNILIGGLLGSTTDSATEKMWQYDRKVVVKCNSAQ